MVEQPAIPSKGLPPISIDDAASMIAINPKEEKLAAIETSNYSRSDILDGIEAYWNNHATSGKKLTARILISSSINSHNYYELVYILEFTWPYFIFGGPAGHATAIANVVIDFGGKRITGSGKGSCYAGMYYPGDPEQCAFSKAVTDAVRNAVRRSF